jgi:biotin carboxyl carrier protein
VTDDQGGGTAAVAPGDGHANGSAEQTNDVSRIEHLAEEVLPMLIARLTESGLGELEVAQAGWRVRLRRSAHGPGTTSGAAVPAGERAVTVRQAARVGAVPVGPGTPAPSASPASASASSASRGSVLRRTEVAPAVGYFAPRAELAAGLAVRSGDRLGTVDVLGMPQDVIAPADGVVGRVLVTGGEAVEYGQELVRIDGIERLVEN